MHNQVLCISKIFCRSTLQSEKPTRVDFSGNDFPAWPRREENSLVWPRDESPPVSPVTMFSHPGMVAGLATTNRMRPMDAKTSDFANFHAWHRALLNADLKLPHGYSKYMLYAYCSAMAEHGKHGKGCHAGDPTIARELGLSRREYAMKYRHLAIELGWLVRTGRKSGRTEILDIAIPEPDEMKFSPGAFDPEPNSIAINDGKHGNRPEREPVDSEPVAAPEMPPYVPPEIIGCGCAGCRRSNGTDCDEEWLKTHGDPWA